MDGARLSHDGRTLTVRVPLNFRQRGGRKLIVAPDGSVTPAAPRKPTMTALVRALANAYRWQKTLDSGDHGTVADLAKAEKVNASYASRVLRMTLHGPQIVEAILDGRHPPTLTLETLLRPFPVIWAEQQSSLVGSL